MCEHRRWSIRLLLWVGLLVGGALGLAACAGDPPSALGLLCNLDEEPDDGGCWGEDISCIEGYCRETTKTCPTTCSEHFDCREANCGKETDCIGGKCQPPGGPATCSSCLTDADCSSACGAKTKCSNKACVEPGCPTSCENDSDCDNCGASSMACINKKCGDPAQTHTYTCTKLADCAGNKGGGWNCGGMGPIAGSCTKPCGSDTDCEINGPNVYKCLGTATKNCHLTCTVVDKCEGGLICCPPKGPHRLCAESLAGCTPP